MGFPITIDLPPKGKSITGGTIPFSLLFVGESDDFVVLPILARIGAEVKATNTITLWLLFELGPAMAFGDFGSEADFAFRVWIGSVFSHSLQRAGIGRIAEHPGPGFGRRPPPDRDTFASYSRSALRSFVDESRRGSGVLGGC